MGMDVEQLEPIFRAGEALVREFKSEARRAFTDREIYEEIVSLANTEGGVLLLGVEDDGHITGTRARHGNTTEPRKLQATIFNNTVPNVNTRVSVLSHRDGKVIAVEVDAYPEPYATTSGKSICCAYADSATWGMFEENTCIIYINYNYFVNFVNFCI